ncbi:MgtC/SapB family protein [Klebsiella pneumoniae]|nr:MgtC/SapB family protein [Klebsiella pneumoniae]
MKTQPATGETYPKSDLFNKAGLIAGVGFLGTGAIIMGNREVETRGLTTAASIWVTAAIGVAAGMGRETTAVLSTLIALLILSVVPWIYRTKNQNKE